MTKAHDAKWARREREAKANAKRSYGVAHRAKQRQARQVRRAVAYVVFVLVVAGALVLLFWMAG